VDAGLLPFNTSTGLFECVKPRVGFRAMHPPVAGCHWPCGVLSTKRLAQWIDFADATNVSLSFDLSPGDPFDFNRSNTEALVDWTVIALDPLDLCDQQSL
jgi:hypothetical protein